MSLSTRLEVYKRTGGKCSCGCGKRIAPYPLGYHHVLPKSRWPEFADEPWNIAGVAAECHANHETAFKRLPSRVGWLPAEHLKLDPQARSYLARTYPGPLTSL